MKASILISRWHQTGGTNPFKTHILKVDSHYCSKAVTVPLQTSRIYFTYNGVHEYEITEIKLLQAGFDFDTKNMELPIL